MNDATNCSSGDQVCDQSVWQPPKFNLQFLLVVTALIAVWTSLTFVQDPASLTVIAVVMLTWLFGCPRTKHATLWIAASIYLPFVWLLLIDYPWNEHRLIWIGRWGYGIGIVPAKSLAYAGLFPDRETWIVFVAAVISLVFFLTCVSLIRFWPRTRWWVLAATLATTGLLSLGCYRGFLM